MKAGIFLCVAMLVGCGDEDPAVVLPEVEDPIPLIDPTIGSGGIGFAYGSAFVGAAVPHGLVKIGPDTNGSFGTIGFQHFSGYWAGDDKIQGFAHLHLHGVGLSDFGVLSVMPTEEFEASKTSVVDYEARFAKADERARPGAYGVTLDSGIDVELVATAHAAHHVYTFPSGAGAVVIDLAKTLADGEVTNPTITLDPATRTFTGSLHARGQMSGSYGGYDLYFAGRTAQDWTDSSSWTDGAMLAFGDGTVQMQIGVSLVSLDGALNNLDTELPEYDVDATRDAAEDLWREVCGVVKLTGGTEAQRRTFYTSLYHAFLMPTVIGDADGTYQLRGGVPTVADGYVQVSDASLWDTYRTVHPLYGWLAPTHARDAARSLTVMAQTFGAYPKWPIATGEGGSMLGASAEIVIADAVLRGVPDVQPEVAYPILRAAALDPVAPTGGRGGRGDVAEYMAHDGWVSSIVGRSVSLTTEYSHNDYALGLLAASLGEDADAATLEARRHGWQELFDPDVGFLRARDPDGSFPGANFDPLDMTEDYAEANAWHSLWMAGAHDVDGLIEVLGGNASFVAKLEELFDQTKADWDAGDPAAANFPRPYYWHGNEPDLNAAFLFAQAGRPDLTAEWAKWIEDHLYSDTPEGLAGNDDGGTLGAWYVLATLGLYPVPGSDLWIVAAPRFPRARVTVDGHTLVIEAEGISETAIYVQSVTLDGEPVIGPYLTHAQLRGASELRFVMGSERPWR